MFEKLVKRMEKYIDKYFERKDEDKERQENYLFNRQKLIMINDICNDYKRNAINPYTALRDITDIVQSIGIKEVK